MDLTHPFSFLAFFLLTRLSLPRWLRPAAATRPDSDPTCNAEDAVAPARLHHDLGLPPANATPPDAQSLRHAVMMRIG